ncbi:MAG: hypothetical protein HY060_04430 [Proteobacteria bacterium]|nr:hypothetical protein [Pseudomonadota bacterium]
MERPAREVEADIRALFGCPPRTKNGVTGCPVSVFADPMDGTVDLVQLETSIDDAPRNLEADVQVRKRHIALIRYLLPTWRKGPAWLTQRLSGTGRRYAKQAVRVGAVTVAIARRWSMAGDWDAVEVMVTKGAALDDPLVRATPPRWMTVEALPPSDRATARREFKENTLCDGSDDMAYICAEDARVAQVALPGGSDLLVVRYPNATESDHGFSVFGPADRHGRRAVTGRFLSARDFEVVPGAGAHAWPDLRLTEFLRCDRDEQEHMIHCWDAVFRWNGTDWDFERRLEYRPDGLWRLGPAAEQGAVP